MRSINALFQREEKRNPNLGLYFVLLKAVAGKKFAPLTIERAFKRLIPKDDYPDGRRQNVKQTLIQNLVSASNPSEEVLKQEE